MFRSGSYLALFAAFLWGQVEDTLKTYDLDTVRIEGYQNTLLLVGETSADKAVRLLPATQLVYRSVPFAQEVVYQGFLPTQTQVSIEGMRVLPACVDRMDPILTFVEAAAIEGVSWQNTNNWGATPTMNVELFSPEGPRGGQAVLSVGDNYHRIVSSFRHRQRVGRFRIASVLTFRQGGDYRIGAWPAFGTSHRATQAWPADTSLNLPAFRKVNLHTAIAYQVSESHRVEASYLGDYFYDVAYPALVMDARHSAMHLISICHTWRDVSEFRAYVSTVFHDMTDEKRPVSEIQNRIVMPGMYMPMIGKTRTSGAIWSLNWWRKEGVRLWQRSEFVSGSAFASMDMFPLGGGTVMRLLNLPDVRIQQGGSALLLDYQQGSWLFHMEGRWNLLAYIVGDTLAYRPLRMYQETYAGASAARRSFSVYEMVGRISWSKSGHTLTFSLSQGTRAPVHTELYAYYLYVPMDNSILMGNSSLRPERLFRLETDYAYAQERWGFRLNLYANRFSDYITAVTFLAPQTPGNSTRQSWRILKNGGVAYTGGFSLQASFHANSSALFEAWAGYTYGWNQTLREPLPWIYPLFGRVRYTQRYRRHQTSLELYTAAAQSHLSRTIYLENHTPAYWLLHVRYGYAAFQNHQFRATLTLSVENVLNAYGWDHLSVGDMPFLGRVVRAGVIVSW
ncbi:MAG: TonB-dependent receptor [Bacteroidia bacterium]|nr:TonB-dependent receptor [Bacteroidia bacterium]